MRLAFDQPRLMIVRMVFVFVAELEVDKPAHDQVIRLEKDFRTLLGSGYSKSRLGKPMIFGRGASLRLAGVTPSLLAWRRLK